MPSSREFSVLACGTRSMHIAHQNSTHKAKFEKRTTRKNKEETKTMQVAPLCIVKSRACKNQGDAVTPTRCVKSRAYKKQIKCVCVGDANVGKDSLLDTHNSQSFPSINIHDIHHQSLDDWDVPLSLWGISGQENLLHLRKILYKRTDVFIVCYSVTSVTSLENVWKKWVPEIRRCCPNAPFLIVGTKSDIRNDSDALKKLQSEGSSLVEFERAQQQGRALGASHVLECSAKTHLGLQQLFNKAVETALHMDVCDERGIVAGEIGAKACCVLL